MPVNSRISDVSVVSKRVSGIAAVMLPFVIWLLCLEKGLPMIVISIFSDLQDQLTHISTIN